MHAARITCYSSCNKLPCNRCVRESLLSQMLHCEVHVGGSPECLLSKRYDGMDKRNHRRSTLSHLTENHFRDAGVRLIRISRPGCCATLCGRDCELPPDPPGKRHASAKYAKVYDLLASEATRMHGIPLPPRNWRRPDTYAVGYQSFQGGLQQSPSRAGFWRQS